MGLDMYLNKKLVFAGQEKEAIIKITNWDNSKNTFNFKEERISIVISYYWRKANHIHAFFVDRCNDGEDDCKEYDVCISLIEDLIRRCEAITADHSLAPTLLPTRDGFFFGGTEYDEWYFSVCEDTAKELKEFLKPIDGALHGFTYQASW